MKYTHYLPRTGERGILIRFSIHKLTKQEFEKITGRLVKSFKKEYYKYTMNTTYEITLHTGEGFYFSSRAFTPVGYIFRTEHDVIKQAYGELPECAPSPHDTEKVRIETVTGDRQYVTPFMSKQDVVNLLVSARNGHGVEYTDDRDQLTVFPSTAIHRLTVLTSPYGGDD